MEEMVVVSHPKARHRTHRFIVVVVVVGFAATIAGFAAARHSVSQTNDQLLRQDAAQGALVFSEVIGTLTGPYQQLGQIVTPSGVSPSIFDDAAAKMAGGASIALLQEVGGQLNVVASVGPLHRDFSLGAHNALIGTLAAQSNANFAGVIVASGTNWLEMVFGKGVVPAGFVVYSEFPVGKTGEVTPLPGVLFPGTDAAAFVGSVTPASVIFRTTSLLPGAGGGKVAISVIASSSISDASNLQGSAVLTSHPGSFESPGHLIVAISANTNLSGNFAGKFPWILGLFGLLATLIVTGLLEVVSRRRDEALGLVEELEVTNADLDAALVRQAEAERGLRQAQRMEAVGQLAGGIAHDFNNLLHVIISYTGFLSESIDPESEMQQDVGEVQKAAHRAAELTRQLLVFSRQDATNAVALDLNKVVLDSERLMRHTLGEDVSLECRVAEDPCCVLGDAGEIEQMLMNLAINARDAMKKGGDLSITVDTVELDVFKAEATGLAPGPFARIEVKDNGEGMAPEVAAKVFEPFFTTKETGRGTGLGLSMVYGIAKRWGGDVSVSSRVGVGTTFTLLFPLSSDAPESSTTEAASSHPDGGHQVVLLAEDEEGVRRSTARILEAAGYRVVQAENGVEASRVFDSESIDILVTDVVMPGGISGKDLADRLRLGKTDLPVVFISGYSADTITERGVLPPSTALVKKPFMPAELLEAMAHAIDERTPATP
jgi:signal transduction histidine kinase/ActR/RegA family two-component response regulator